jgi:hypothetical protein
MKNQLAWHEIVDRLPPSEIDQYRIWRGVRVVEGARLELVYTPNTCIEGSNPSLSANFC